MHAFTGMHPTLSGQGEELYMAHGFYRAVKADLAKLHNIYISAVATCRAHFGTCPSQVRCILPLPLSSDIAEAQENGCCGSVSTRASPQDAAHFAAT